MLPKFNILTISKDSLKKYHYKF